MAIRRESYAASQSASPLKSGKIGMAGIVLCSVSALGCEIIRDNMRQLWFKAYSNSTAYGNSLRASQKDRGFGTFENLYMERYSAMKYTGVSGPIVVCGWESQLHEAEMLRGEGD